MEGNTEAKKPIQVKLISTERVKPSSPTPSHLENFTLSYVDQIIPLFPPFLTPGILFYPSPPQNQPLDITTLKTSLSRTLTKFYPLAGRVQQSTITCTDEGIPFFETRVDCPLIDVLYSAPNPEILSKLLPPKKSLGLVEGYEDHNTQPISELIHLAIQISVFTCGGVAISWYDIHKITDGISSANFFKHWAAVASNHCDEVNLVDPNFGTAPTTFPPLPLFEPLLGGTGKDVAQQECSIVVKSFLFRDSDVCKLKLEAASEQVPNPTRFLTIAGFIWEQALASKTTTSNIKDQRSFNDMSKDSSNIQDEPVKDEKTALTLNLDLRPRINPPLPQGSIGNLVTGTVASAEVHAGLPDLVARIQAAVCKKKDEIKGYNVENGVKAMRENWVKLLGTYVEYKDMAYKLTSWCNAGYSELDFGFGKPKWMVPTNGKVNGSYRNLIILNDYSDSNGDGIEAWLFLEEKEMEILESNTKFLAYASPVF